MGGQVVHIPKVVQLYVGVLRGNKHVGGGDVSASVKILHM